MMIKKIFIGLGLLVTIFVGAIIYLVVMELKQEEILKNEIIVLTSKDLEKDDFDMVIKTKGDYAYIERSIKKYYKDLSDNIKEINIYLQDDDLREVLSPIKLKENGPNFTNQYELINNAKYGLIKALKNVSSLCSDEYVKNLLDKDKFSDSADVDYLMNLYKDFMYTDKDLENMAKLKVEMSELANNMKNYLDKELEILDLLSKNSKVWKIENDKLYISDENVMNNYNNLYKDLMELSSRIQKNNNVNNGNKQDSVMNA